MKVTALIPDDIIKEVKRYAKSRTLTESLILALNEWISLKKIKELNQAIAHEPMQFQEGFSAKDVRSINRQQ